jgi:hypothetical protein
MLESTRSTTNLEHLSFAEIVCFIFVTVGALAPRRLGDARRATNHVGCCGKFERVGFHLRKGRKSR